MDLKYLLDFLGENKPADNRLSNEQRGALMKSMMRLINIKSDVLTEGCSSHSEIMLLYCSLDWFAEHGEHITAAQAAKMLRVSAPSASRTLKGLEEKGLIERDSDPRDRRSVRIVVTKTGERRVNRILSYVFTTMDKALGEFSEEELAAMIKLHDKLVCSIEKAIKSSKKAGDGCRSED